MEYRDEDKMICFDCGEDIDEETAWFDNGHYYCEKCYFEIASTCEFCGKQEEDYQDIIEFNGERYCKDCFDVFLKTVDKYKGYVKDKYSDEIIEGTFIKYMKNGMLWLYRLNTISGTESICINRVSDFDIKLVKE